MNTSNTVFYKIYNYWNRQSKIGFLSCVIAGLLIHLYAFTNIIPNADGLSRVSDPQQMTVSGRFFLHYASMIHGYVQSPMLIGILTVLFLSISALMVIDLLEIKGNLTAALIGIFMTAFPSVVYMHMFMFTASAYAFGILLSVSSIWFFRKKTYGFWPAIVLLALSVGTYQSYFAVAISLSLICVLKDLLNKKLTEKEIFFHGLKMIVYLGVGIVFYYGILQIFLRMKGLSLLSYRGMDNFVGGLGIKSILASVIATYKDFIKYFFQVGFIRYNTLPLFVCNCILVLLAIAAFLLMIKENRKLWTPIRCLILLLIIVLIPVGFDFTNVLSNSTPIMRYSLVFVYVMALAILDWKKTSYSNVTLIVSAFMILLFAQIANTAYTSSATAHRATEAFATNLVSRVESLDGYKQGMDVIVIGGFPTDVYYSAIESFEIVNYTSCLPDTVMLATKHVYYYLNDWLNVPWSSPGEETFIEVSDSLEFKTMPLYPSDGSVQIIDDRVIVKLAEEYTPLRDFEKAYLERR